jgi:hypothetical protein
MTGSMTYYNDIGYGACGAPINAATENLVAVSYQWWTTANPNNDPICQGISVQVTYNGKTITVPVKDKCPSCDSTHIDLSQPAFQQLAPLSVGVVNGITWKFVGLSGRGGGGAPPPPSKLPAPSGLRVTKTTNTSVSLAWNAVSGAVPYRVMRDSVQVAQRRAIGLARVLSAAVQSTPRAMRALKPALAAHPAAITGRQATAATLRDVLRELYPAGLCAFADPAERVSLAILDVHRTLCRCSGVGYATPVPTCR